VAVIEWLRAQAALETLEEANALLVAAGMAPLNDRQPSEAALLKDLSPTLRIVLPRPHTRHNLPYQISSFIGRDREITELTALVQRTRLVTLTGAGGVGKTRLALEVAGQVLDDFEDGVWFVNLAPVADPALLPKVISGVLKLVEQPNYDPLDSLASHLEARHVLLILDNCEHVIEASIAVATTLLGRCAGLHTLTTSRETLRVPGEHVHRVTSLALPGDATKSLDQLRSVESIALFVERARAVQSAFDLDLTTADVLVRICKRLDGIPLAIEVTAALTQTISLTEIEARLRDQSLALGQEQRAVVPRHRTMRATLDWSFNLLSPAEQLLLARLSVFSGGWRIEQAAAICEPIPASPAAREEPHTVTSGGSASPSILTLLTELVQKSLVMAEARGDSTRYHLLEPIRQYAAEKLDGSGETPALRHRHALAYLALAQSAQQHLHATEEKWWIDRLEGEHDNFRAALQWSHNEVGAQILGLRLAVALWEFWWIRVHISEGRRWLESFLQTGAAVAAPELRAWALLGTCILENVQSGGFFGYHAGATKTGGIEEALALFRAMGDHAGAALALLVGREPGSIERGVVVSEESMRIASGQNERPWVTLYAQIWHAFLTHMHGDALQASTLLRDCLASARQMGDARAVTASLGYLSDVSLSNLDFAAAAGYAKEALQVAEDAANIDDQLQASNHLSHAWHFLGHLDQAKSLCLEARDIALAHGMHNRLAWALTRLGLIARDQGDYESATSYFKESITWYRDKLGIWAHEWNVLGLATLATMREKLVRAARLYGALDAWLRNLNLLQLGHNQLQFGTYIDATRAKLGDAAYAAAFDAGRAMTTDQMYQLALCDEN
jgi:predicted ATPase